MNNKNLKVIIKANTFATKLYHHILVGTQAGKKALRYLHNRQVNDATINAYQLGWAPKKSILFRELRRQGMTKEQMRMTGLFADGKNGKLYDRFFSRIMYPIKNRFSSTIAFSGRVLNKAASPAKYLNIPETALFKKRMTIFNLDKALKAIKKSGHVILVEGYMDVISAYQAGVCNVIASMGTSLTKSQIEMIKELTKNVTVCYDGDKPGQDAIARAMKLLSGTGIHRSVIQMPKGIDPDEYRRKYGNEAFCKYMKVNVETPTSFWLNHLAEGLDMKNVTSQITYLKRAVRVIAAMSRPGHYTNINKALLAQNVYADKLSQMFHVSTRAVYEDIKAINDSVVRRDNKQSTTMLEQAEQALLHIALGKPALLNKLSLRDVELTPVYAKLFVVIKDYYRKHHNINKAYISDIAKQNKLAGTIRQIIATSPRDTSYHAAKACVLYINQHRPAYSHVQNLSYELHIAYSLGDLATAKKLSDCLIKA